VQIGVAGSAEFDAWLDVTISGFASPDTQGVPSHEPFDRQGAERCVRDFAEAPGFVRWLAHRRGQPAGAATMRLTDGIAQLCGSATLPEHRRRGVQSALLAHRLDAAARAGCTIAVVTTQPGSKSQQNVRRNGFELLYSRVVLRREPHEA
jgi:GNAT superfamily N-acetyltransferase